MRLAHCYKFMICRTMALIRISFLILTKLGASLNLHYLYYFQITFLLQQSVCEDI